MPGEPIVKNAFRLCIAGSACLLAAVIVSGQQQAAVTSAIKTISIGQPIEETQRLIKEREIEFGEGGFSFADRDDAANLIVVLDKNSTYAAIHYSKSKKAVTGISLVFYPPGRPQKSYQAWLSAKSITLETDGSYAVHFLPPRSVDPAEPKRQSVYPGDPAPKRP
jgi:hypothetical protein